MVLFLDFLYLFCAPEAFDCQSNPRLFIYNLCEETGSQRIRSVLKEMNSRSVFDVRKAFGQWYLSMGDGAV